MRLSVIGHDNKAVFHGAALIKKRSVLLAEQRRCGQANAPASLKPELSLNQINGVGMRRRVMVGVFATCIPLLVMSCNDPSADLTPSSVVVSPTTFDNPPTSNPSVVLPTSTDSSISSVPRDVTALCNDGTYSYSAHHQGSCAGHQGVAKFF
jgi:hypothetical protein